MAGCLMTCYWDDISGSLLLIPLAKETNPFRFPQLQMLEEQRQTKQQATWPEGQELLQ